MRPLRRYAPFVAIALVIGLAVAVVGGGSSDSPDGDGPDESLGQEALVRSGPMTPQKAELVGEDVDFGPRCDTETGRIMLPSALAPPCVEPFDDDNGGATSPGVTGDEITIVFYQADPATNPMTAAMLSGAGVDVDSDSARQVLQDYIRLYNQVFETYGREVVVETYTSSGPIDDEAAARADAIAISDMEPFAVVPGLGAGGTVFASELAARGIICAPGCGTAMPQAVMEDNRPYVWSLGPTPEQGAALAAELFGKLAGPGPAELAGDPEMRGQDRVYGLVHFDTPDGAYQPATEALVEGLAAQGVEIAADIPLTADVTQAQETTRTIIARLQDAGVTTVIYYGDPFAPSGLTREASTQGYQPEWLLGPSLYMDYTIAARQTDTEQWSHGFGMSLQPARAELSATPPYRIYEWAYGDSPASNLVTIIEPPLTALFIGIHLAGPNLTPESFRDGLFRYPPSDGGPTSPRLSFGDQGAWPGLDYGGSDDAAIIWFDPDASGEDEFGNPGSGMYRYANGGQRYTIGGFPTSAEEAGLFDEPTSATIVDGVPEQAQPSDYPPPEL